MLKKGIGHIKR